MVNINNMGLGEDTLQIGDIVFIRIANFLYRRVADATRSWTSHVGMIIRREGDEWIVAESAVPLSRYYPLSGFIARSANGQCAIKRPRAPMDPAGPKRLQAEADRRMRKWYRLGFDLDSRLQFCSKFVYEVYRESLGIKIGTVESFRELLSKNPANPLTFWKIWFFGRIPWDRRTVTPGSQYESALLETVYQSSDLPFNVLNDVSMYRAGSTTFEGMNQVQRSSSLVHAPRLLLNELRKGTR